MRIRYAYKLENGEGATSFVVLNHKLSEEEVANKFADKGIVSATFHDRVRTGFRLNAEGALVETGLTRKPAAEQVEAAPAPTPKAKKSSKKSK